MPLQQTLPVTKFGEVGQTTSIHAKQNPQTGGNLGDPRDTCKRRNFETECIEVAFAPEQVSPTARFKG